MPTRLQVVLDDAELAEIRSFAASQRMTVAEWVRQTLRRARQPMSTNAADRKLLAVREGFLGNYPTADIDQMLAEIESGYTATPTE